MEKVEVDAGAFLVYYYQGFMFEFRNDGVYMTDLRYGTKNRFKLEFNYVPEFPIVISRVD